MIATLAAVPVLIWLYLLLARGAFWRAPVLPRVPAEQLTSGVARQVVAVIPARNEAALIAASVRSLLRQRFAGSLHVIVVDDASGDATANTALATAAELGASGRLTLLESRAVAPEWTGKLWAMAQGLEAALARAPDYVLFTDADVCHDPDHLTALVHEAEEHERDLVSAMVTLAMRSRAERWLLPAFVFFFFMIYPPAWVASRRFGTAAAAGGCMLVRRRALERIGGLAAIRTQIIDDCALARVIKRTGGSIYLALTRSAHSLRGYGSASHIAQMIARTAFNQLRHSYLLLAATLIGLVITYALPPLLLLTGRSVAAALGVSAWALMCLAYAPTLRFYQQGLLWSASLPAIAVFYATATVYSTWQYARGRGGQWKGRIQDARARAS